MSNTSPKDWNKAVIEEFRANGGKVGGHFEKMNLLLLHTMGAKSGLPRLNPAAYLEDNGRIAIFASKAGAPTNPDWYHNIVANPQVEVEVGTEKFTAQAEIAAEPERTRLYDQMAAINPGFGEYQRQTTRVIPVVLLHRAG